MMSAPSRRDLLRGAALLGGAATLGSGAGACSQRPPAPSPTTGSETEASSSAPEPASETGAAPAGSTGRSLLAYFSRPGENYHYGGRRDLEIGNTERLATLIAARSDCDVYRIEAADPYPDSYDETVDRNASEQRAEARPAIAADLPDITDYDTILLGSPIWNVRPPRIMLTFVESFDLDGKIVVPFVTFAVSGLGRTEDDYTAAAPNAVLRAGLAVQGEEVAGAADDVEEWMSNVVSTP